MPILYLKATRPEVRAVVRSLPGLLSGQQADATGVVAQVLNAIGLQFLGLVKEAFLTKARGGTDEAGIKWPPLKPATIAYSRRHPGRPTGKRPLLTSDLDKLWRNTYAHTYRWLLAKGQSNAAASGQAAAHAWIVTKQAGGKTVLGEYGKVPVEILRDRGILYASLSHAITGPGAVGVGTNDIRGGTHHRGNPAKGIPERAFWPDAEHVPERWIGRVMDTLSDGVGLLLRRLFGR